ESYDREMFPIDVEHQQTPREARDGAFSDRLLFAKKDIYRRYWRRTDPYWEPGSFGWPSEHDPAQLVRRFAAPRRAGGLCVHRQTGGTPTAAPVVELIDGELHITDQDIDWGRGLLLSRPPRGPT